MIKNVGTPISLSRVIVLGLSQRLPSSRIYAEGGAISSDPNAVLAVNIQRLDLDQAGTGDLGEPAGAARYLSSPAAFASSM